MFSRSITRSSRSAGALHWFVVLYFLLLVSCQGINPAPTAPPSPTAITPIAVSTAIQRSDQLLAVEGSTTLYRLMDSGEIRHIRDWAAFVAFAFRFADVVSVPPGELADHSIGMPLTRWVTGVSDPALYVLINGRRHLVAHHNELAVSNVSPVEVALLPDELLESLPLAENNLAPVFDGASVPVVTAATWWQDSLWVADESGRLREWQDGDWQLDEHRLPDGSTIHALAPGADGLYVGTNSGSIWALASNGSWQPLVLREGGWISALALGSEGKLWYADAGHYDVIGRKYRPGRGLVRLDLDTLEESELLSASADATNHPLRSVTNLAWDQEQNILWTGTRFGGLYRYQIDTEEWQNYTTFNSNIAGNTINALHLMPDGDLWVAAGGGLQLLADGTFADPSGPGGILSVTSSGDDVWAAGANVVAHSVSGQTLQVDRAFDTPELLDRFAAAVLDDTGLPWIVGEQRLIHFDGASWLAYDLASGNVIPYVPGVLEPTISTWSGFPSPHEDYSGWLRAWPRPEADNGCCMHYLQGPSGDEFEVRLQIARLRRLGAHWVLVNYTNRSQLLMMAPLFKEAGIMVIWRPFVRPYEKYEFWAEDVVFLQSQGVAPYIQVYNEPNLDQEWDGQPIDQAVYQSHLLPALQEVVDAGGLAGLQHIDAAWLREDLRKIKAAGMGDVFERLFFVPHPYGANHPPDYDQDNIGVLSFREHTAVFEEEIGFVPPMIAGEGGWRLGDGSDERYPAVDEALHRDYHVAVFDWFRTGVLSNGEPLPDYLFAFCPWLISDPNDPAAWFDSASGDRVLTVQGVEDMPDFERLFSWGQ